MANQWLRLWHDMPTDPKWRTISKASGQRIGDVMAVYVHLLVCASNATERGRTQSFNSEDVASALDIDTEQVEQIITAMQGRVLEGDLLKGWESRQVAREDGSAQRSKAWREAQKAASERTPNAAERNRTPDKDKEKIKKENTTSASLAGFDRFWDAWPKNLRKEAKGKCHDAWVKAKAEPIAEQILAHVEAKKQTDWTKDGARFVEAPLVYLNQRKWEGAEDASASTSNLWAGAVN